MMFYGYRYQECVSDIRKCLTMLEGGEAGDTPEGIKQKEALRTKLLPRLAHALIYDTYNKTDDLAASIEINDLLGKVKAVGMGCS